MGSEEETELQNRSKAGLHLLKRVGKREIRSNRMLVYNYTILEFKELEYYVIY